MSQLLIGPRAALLEVVTLVVDVILAAMFLENATSRMTSVKLEMMSTEAVNGCRDAICHVVQPHEVFCDETKRYGQAQFGAMIIRNIMNVCNVSQRSKTS
jgi:hypothetical protein